MIDKEFIKRKTQLILEDLELLRDVENETFENLVNNNPLRWNGIQHVLLKVIGRGIDMNQHLIAELAYPKMKIPLDYTETFLKLKELKVLPKKFAEEIAASAGFRNMLVHEYNNLDDKIIYNTIGDAIEQYTRYCDYLLKFIEKINK